DPGRYEIRVRPRSRRKDHARGRDPDARQQPLLEERKLRRAPSQGRGAGKPRQGIPASVDRRALRSLSRADPRDPCRTADRVRRQVHRALRNRDRQSIHGAMRERAGQSPHSPQSCSFLRCERDIRMTAFPMIWRDFVAGSCTLLLAMFATASVANAKIQPFPAGFHTQNIQTNGTTIYVRVGGQGPAVLLIHGFGDTGDMWAPLAAELARNHVVIVPDLRGMGLSAHPDTGYTKKNQAFDMAGVLDALHV